MQVAKKTKPTSSVLLLSFLPGATYRLTFNPDAELQKVLNGVGRDDMVLWKHKPSCRMFWLHFWETLMSAIYTQSSFPAHDNFCSLFIKSRTASQLD